MPSAEDSIEIAATTGLFAANLFPGRSIPEPRSIDARPGHEVCGPEHDKIGDELFDTCKVNVSSTLVKAVINGIKRKFAIKEDSTWRSVAGGALLDAIQELEAKTSPYIPLRACVGFWEANMLFNHYWSSICRLNKKQATSGTGKNNDVAEIVQGSSNESRLVISEATNSSVVDEEFTFDFDASSEFTVDSPQRYLLGKRLGDVKTKSNSSRKHQRTVTAEEEGEQHEGQ